MSAEAIARLRDRVAPSMGGCGHEACAICQPCMDLRAFLAAHDEKSARIEALEQFIYEMCVEKRCHGSTPSLIAEAVKLGVVHIDHLTGVLAKAGGK